jgi:hypothetical protein
MPAYTRDGTNGERGMALVVVVVFVFLSLLALSASYNRVHQAFVLEQSSDRIASGSDGVDRALGVAIARFHTGVPSTSPYECRLRLRTTDGSAMLAFKITHAKLDIDSWTVKAEPSTTTLEDCPANYSTSCPLVVP